MILRKIYKRQQEAELFREKEFRAAVKIQVKLLLRNRNITFILVMVAWCPTTKLPNVPTQASDNYPSYI